MGGEFRALGTPVLVSGVCGWIPEGKVKTGMEDEAWRTRAVSGPFKGPSQGGEDKVAQHTVSKGRPYEIPVKSLIWGLTLPSRAMGLHGWGVHSVHF